MRIFSVAKYLTIVYADAGFFRFFAVEIIENCAIVMR